MSGKKETEFRGGVNYASLIWNATIPVFSVIDIPTFFFQETKLQRFILIFF